MAPIHKGIAIGRKFTILGKISKKIKKKLVADSLPTLTVDAILDRIAILTIELEEDNNTWAEDGRAEEYIYKTQVILLNQLFRLTTK